MAGCLMAPKFTDLKSGFSRSVMALVSAALVLAGCSNYRVVLDGSLANYNSEGPPQPRALPPEGGAVNPAAEIVLPEPAEPERVIDGTPEVEDPMGWVQLRFDVTETGAVDRVRVVTSTNPKLEQAATDLMLSWPYRPGTLDGAPVGFQDLETVIAFLAHTSDGEYVVATAGRVVVLVVLSALHVAASALGIASRGVRRVKLH